MASVEAIARPIEPLKQSIVVKRAPAEAFDIFTARFGTWWPYQRFSVHQADTRACVFETRLGGEVYEVTGGGNRVAWGKVVVWEPPSRFVMTWHPGRDPKTAQEVEFRFVAVAEGTRVELEHRAWEKFGAGAVDEKRNYEGGWAVVLGTHFAGACR